MGSPTTFRSPGRTTRWPASCRGRSPRRSSRRSPAAARRRGRPDGGSVDRCGRCRCPAVAGRVIDGAGGRCVRRRALRLREQEQTAPRPHRQGVDGHRHPRKCGEPPPDPGLRIKRGSVNRGGTPDAIAEPARRLAAGLDQLVARPYQCRADPRAQRRARQGAPVAARKLRRCGAAGAPTPLRRGARAVRRNEDRHARERHHDDADPHPQLSNTTSDAAIPSRPLPDESHEPRGRRPIPTEAEATVGAVHATATTQKPAALTRARAGDFASAMRRNQPPPARPRNDCFLRPDGAEPTIDLATRRSPGAMCPDDRSWFSVPVNADGCLGDQALLRLGRRRRVPVPLARSPLPQTRV